MDTLAINIDQLQNRKEKLIDTTISSDFLDIYEKELYFQKNVYIQGKAYLSNTHLVLQLHAQTTAYLPCIICNSFIPYPIRIQQFYHSVEIQKITPSSYDYSQILRTALLLELPNFIECNENHCPERKNIEKYIKKPKDTYFPFQSTTLPKEKKNGSTT